VQVSREQATLSVCINQQLW